MHVIGSIVDDSCKLIGLIFNGKDTEFGGKSNSVVEKRFPIKALPNGFKTPEVEINNGSVAVLGDFRLSHLDRMELFRQDQCIPFDNKMELLSAFSDGKNTVGFTVGFLNNSVQKKLRYNDVINRALYFKPSNFVVRDVNGKYVICGKQGVMKLEELPVIYINGAPSVNKAATTEKRVDRNETERSKVKDINEYQEVSGIETDILDIYDFIRSNNGYILKIRDEKYVPQDTSKKVDYGNFKPFKGLEIAGPLLKYGEKKINATLAFKKLGFVTSEETGNNYKTFIHTSKSVFADGMNTMNRIGVVIKPEAIEWFRQRNLICAMSVWKDREVLNNLAMFMNVNDMRYIEIDISKVGVIADSKRKEKIMTNEQLKEACIQMYTCKLILKYMGNAGELVKGIKKRIGNQKYAELYAGGLNHEFRGYDEKTLQDIKDCGINIITGEFQRYASESSGKESKEDLDIYIEYLYGGLDYTKVTGKQMVQMAAIGDDSVIPRVMINTINTIEHMKDDSEKLEAVKKIKMETERKVENINRKLWEHRAAMYLEGRRKYIHVHDKASWVPDDKSRAKKFAVYLNKDCEGLSIRFRGIAL